VIGGTCSALAFCAFLFVRRRRANGTASKHASSNSLLLPELGEPLLAATTLGVAAAGSQERAAAWMDSSEPHAFSLAQLAAATAGFADHCKLDEGAFGAVYRGTLQPGGTPVAIKLLKAEAAAKVVTNKKHEEWMGVGGFRKELEVLSKYRHKNIVWLLGFCLSDDTAVKQCLVFEWMAGGSLNKRLVTSRAQPPLSCKERFDIASDVARGLEYLHTQADPPVIHQDVKSDNILLAVIGGTLIAKVADFGTARYTPDLLEDGNTHHSTGVVVGTKPYM
jgi:hypothetical protein